MTAILETPRVRLREFTAYDLDPLAPLVADEEQMRFYGRPKTRDETADWLRRNLALYRNCGYGFWAMEDPPTSEFLGYCGFRPQEELNEIEMGWHVMKIYWNQGLATEAALACRDLAFDRFAIPRLIAVVVDKNAASVRVAEKIGMCPEAQVILDGYPCVIYAVATSPAGTDEGPTCLRG